MALKTFCLCIALCAATGAQAAEPLKKLSARLEKGLKEETNKKVAVLGFPYADGGQSSGSSIIQERLTTFLVGGGKAEVIERSLIDKVMDELKLGASGALDAESTQKVGKLLGVGAVVTGTLNDLAKGKTEVNARLIQTETGRILAAGQAKIERTWPDVAVKPGTTHPTTTPTATTGNFLGKPLVQIALLLDTSSSMDGLIDQAKAQLWKVVNQLAESERGGANPAVQVALYEYGNSALSADSGYVRQVLPFTTDLDKVSEALFALRTNGGEEYCGWAMKDAVNNLLWDKHADVYRAVFIAGNEPFTQGPVDFRASVAEAAGKNIFVNTIFCGNRQEGVATQWKAGADLGGGDYTNIEQNLHIAAVRAPQDEEIERLGAKMNETFIPYGETGRLAYARQAAQDRNAAAFAPAAAAPERAAFKARAQYSAGVAGDAVNQVMEAGGSAADLKREELPAQLRSMAPKELESHIKGKAAERKAIQEKIKTLSEARRRYIAQQEKSLAATGKATLDSALIQSVRRQAEAKQFKFRL